MSNPQGHDHDRSEFLDHVLNEVPRESTVSIRPYTAPVERKDEPGKRYDAGKLRFDLLPADWEKALAEVLTKGAAKYEDHNWQRGMSWSRCYAALRRHLAAFWSGDDYDKETGLHHLAHAAWGCLAILTYVRTHPELDDRYSQNASCKVPPKA